MIISEIFNDISASELYAVVRAAASIPTCVQYKGRLGNMDHCDIHFYGKSTAGCTVSPTMDDKIKFPAKKFKNWKEVREFIEILASQAPQPPVYEVKPAKVTSEVIERYESIWPHIETDTLQLKEFIKRKCLTKKRPRAVVALVIDSSGSMINKSSYTSEARFTVAVKASLVMYDICVTLGVPIAVFSHYAFDNKHIHIRTMAEFDQTDSEDRYRITSVSPYGGDREDAAIRYAYDMLRHRSEPEKIIFVMGDGQPANYHSHENACSLIHEVVSEAENSGIKVYAAAMDTDNIPWVKEIYGNFSFEMDTVTRMPEILLNTLVSNENDGNFMAVKKCPACKKYTHGPMRFYSREAFLECQECGYAMPAPASLGNTPVHIKPSASLTGTQLEKTDSGEGIFIMRNEMTSSMGSADSSGDQGVINSFRDKYSFLSNFYTCKIYVDGLTFSSLEAAYQSAKCTTEDERIKFAGYTANEAKRNGFKVKLRADWESVKDQIMLNLVRAKFGQNPILARKLTDTKDAILIEGNYWHDNHFGACSCRRCKGKEKLNRLGEFLMIVRAELQR